MVEEIILQNLVSNKSLKLDMNSVSDFILSYVNWGNVTASNQTYKLADRIGEEVSSSSIGTRDIEIVGWIVAKTEIAMNENKAILNRFVNPTQTIKLTYKTYMLKFLPSNSIAYSSTIEENNEVMCKFKISGISYYPLFSDAYESRIDAANIKPMFHFPLIISKEPSPPGGVIFGERSKSLFIVVNNKGDLDTGMRIVFDATRGTVKNPKIYKADTQEYFAINKTLDGQEIVEINTSASQRKVIGKGRFDSDYKNYFKYRDLNSTWLQLSAGDNILKYEADEGLDNLTVSVYFTAKFMEVERCF